MRDAIFIVGPGRSGSSALARVLSLSGAALPLKLLPANFANPSGYREPQTAVEINDAFLAAQATAWYDMRADVPVHDTASPAARARCAAASELMTEGFQPNGPIVIKEPRIALLLPLWLEAAVRSGLRPTIVHNFRNPNDASASLIRRDGLTREHCDALWLKYNLLAERDGRAMPRVFVCY